MSSTRWMIVCAVGLLAERGFAQTSLTAEALKGRVVDAASGAPISEAEVRVGEGRTRTDSRGFFEIPVSRGSWNVKVSAADHQDYARPFEVGADPLPAVEIALAPRVRFREDVEVTAPAAVSDSPGTLPVRPAQVLAAAGSLDNIFRVVQTLPGVVATDEFGSSFSVRGGSPDQNLTIMDGVEIHNPYRLFGLTSAFNPETVERFEFTAGGFSAKYGDRLSSLLIVENRDGSRERRFGGSSSLSLTDGNVIFEGKLPGSAKGSWLLTTRRTYYDLVAERIVHEDLPAFRDVQFRASWEPRAGQRLTLTGLRSREDADASVDANAAGERGAVLSNVHNDVFSVAIQSKVGRGISKSVASWYREANVFDADARFRSDSHRSNTPGSDAAPLTGIALSWNEAVRDVSAREELSLPIGGRHVLETGFELHRLRSGVTFTFTGETLTDGRAPTSALDGLPKALNTKALSHTRSGGWVEDRFRLTDAATLTPGLRVDWSGLSGRATISPRLSGALELGRSTRLRAALGLYTQSPGYEKLFQSDYLVDQVDLDFERARHVIVGLERDLTPGLTARVELYHKRFDRLIVGRLETKAERDERLFRYDFPAELLGEIPRAALITDVPTNDGKGTSYGFDLYVARTARGPEARLTGWASYTYGVAERETYGRLYPFDYDRRHAFTFVGNYRLGPRFAISATGRAFSGFPWTPAAGVRVAGVEAGSKTVPERDSEGRLVYTVASGGIDTMNSMRLPVYARLDLRATFRPRGEKGRWQFYLEAINALRRRNTTGMAASLGYDPTSDRPRLVETPESSIGLLPSFGVRFQFD